MVAVQCTSLRNLLAPFYCIQCQIRECKSSSDALDVKYELFVVLQKPFKYRWPHFDYLILQNFIGVTPSSLAVI